jgi:hypothetical protein
MEVKPIPSIYQEKLNINKLWDHDWDDISKTVVQRIPTFNSAKSSLYRARRKQIPALPTTRDDIRLDGKWTLYRDNKEVRTLIRRAVVLPLIPLDRIEDV